MLKATRAVARIGKLVGTLAVLPMVAACVVVQNGTGPRRRPPAEAPPAPGFSASERQIVQAYYTELHRRGGCPPGLAKKHNGCQSPGRAKTRYVTGRPLSREVVVLPLPRELAVCIGRPPRGYQYGLVDGDVAGLAVNLAARVEQAATEGSTYVSSTVRDLLLGGNQSFEDRGEHTLKGIAGAWRLHELAT